ncbi:MAG: ThuA domain-containing protein [Planctomycetes bacterium]|nr:ThuA domain-containing protein [Planctomycetota bacterium]
MNHWEKKWRSVRIVGTAWWVGLFVALAAANGLKAAEKEWVVYSGFAGPGNGKHIVLISGDEEYRSEEALPQLGKILAKHHGFKCTVLFAIDPKTGLIAPNILDNIPGLETLDSADLMIIFTRFRRLPDEQMEHIDRYLKSGRPVIGMRTATHAFRFPAKSKWAHYSNGYKGEKKEWTDGFGRLVLGEKWIAHHGHHGHEATRGLIAPDAKGHPIVRGIKDGDIFGPTDVYAVRLPLPGDSKPIILGQVLAGMNPDDPPAPPSKNRKTGRVVDKNDPMMPVAWTKTYQIPGGRRGRVFTTTMGAAVDLKSAGLRRLIVNAVYWCLGMEDQIPPSGCKADAVGTFEPTFYGYNKYRRGMKPSDFELK